jgi:hypothetical protein
VPLLVAVILMVVAACGGGNGEAESTTQPEGAAGDAQREAQVLASTEQFIAAAASTDVDAVMTMLQASLTDKERQRYGFRAAWPTHVVTDCEVTQASDFLSSVACEADLIDPVWLEMGPTAIIVTYQTWSDGMTWDFGGDTGTTGGELATPDTYADTLTAYSEYLSRFRADDYSTDCDPEAHEITETVQEYGITLVPACGELLASVATDVAEWLKAGRPDA